MGTTSAVRTDTDPRLQSLFDADRALCKVARNIKVLQAIGWPAEMETTFLDAWNAGRPQLPKPPTVPVPLDAELDALDTIMHGLDRGHPIGNWLFKTAWSYRVAARMLEQIGQPGFTRCSVLLYGRPDVRYRSQDASNADGAREVLTITDDLIDRQLLPPVECAMNAEVFAEHLRERIGEFFTHDRVEVVLDATLSSKATASSTKIKLRATAVFSDADLDQLLEHEAFIHTATSLNGKHQPYFKVLGLGAPRTTRAQEGLATFAECVTGAMDIVRLRRIALRVVMVQRALEGADFIEVFKGFLDAGQSDVESYRSASRIFRGGDVHGRVCFTKDGAYLEGLFITHLFVRKALQEGRAELLRMLVVGRVTTGDAINLAPYQQAGLIGRATYVPPWAREPQRILSLLEFSAAAQKFRLDRVELNRFADYEDEVIEEAGTGY
ncbi:tyrosine/phenylalanine carboxypeptidase domain-containing protein [Cognatilysobacter terrigena]|uniref:tyrosine/phenylalanine carboxypeptidase domain-containing protein n=1 Tax=Cognatilysobacter terrigena TaxID=2488749 RepID=UPI00141502BB|nr:tyrosine/phenylalanine carboxypeptidase domain-containing protein [Lysobacter terrigena]